MPLYEYRCDDCQSMFEELAPATQADAASCSSCGSTRVRRLLSVFTSPRAAGSDGAAMPAGGCCGGGCGHC